MLRNNTTNNIQKCQRKRNRVTYYLCHIFLHELSCMYAIGSKICVLRSLFLESGNTIFIFFACACMSSTWRIFNYIIKNITSINTNNLNIKQASININPSKWAQRWQFCMICSQLGQLGLQLTKAQRWRCNMFRP